MERGLKVPLLTCYEQVGGLLSAKNDAGGAGEGKRVAEPDLDVRFRSSAFDCFEEVSVSPDVGFFLAVQEHRFGRLFAPDCESSAEQVKGWLEVLEWQEWYGELLRGAGTVIVDGLTRFDQLGG